MPPTRHTWRAESTRSEHSIPTSHSTGTKEWRKLVTVGRTRSLAGRSAGPGKQVIPSSSAKWPSFLTSNDDNPVVPTRGKEKQTARKYFVPFHFIQNMHLQSFWDKVKPNHLTALYIKKTIGISYSNPDIEASSTDSSEVKWPLEDGSSRASREQDGQPVPDPSELGANEPVTYS